MNMLLAIFLVGYCCLWLSLNLFSPLKVGFVSWFQLLFVKLKLPAASIDIGSISLRMKLMYLFHLAKLKPTHHEGLFTIHISNVTVDLQSYTPAASDKERISTKSSSLSVCKIIKLINWLRFVLPLTVVVHALTIKNSSLKDYENKTITLDSFTVSFSSKLSCNVLSSQLHISVSELKLWKNRVIKSWAWTLSGDALVLKGSDVKFTGISSTCVTANLNLDIQLSKTIIDTMIPRNSSLSKEEHAIVKDESKFDIREYLDKFQFESIYFAFEGTSILTKTCNIEVKDIVLGLHSISRDDVICRRYINSLLHKLTCQITGLDIKYLNSQNSKHYIEFSNVSSIWDITSIVNIIQNIDDTEKLMKLCDDDTFIARSFITIANVSFTTTLEDCLQHVLKEKRNKVTKTSQSASSKVETSVDNEKRVRRLHNILLVAHKIRTRAQFLTNCVQLKLSESVTAQVLIDDILFDTSHTDNISSLFADNEEAYTPTKALVLSLRNIKLEVIEGVEGSKLFVIDSIESAASLFFNNSRDLVLIHDINLIINTVELCLDNIGLIKKINALGSHALEQLNKQEDEVSDAIFSRETPIVNKSPQQHQRFEKFSLPKFIQNIQFIIKSVTVVTCFKTPIKYYQGIDFTEMNNYKRGLGFEVRDLIIDYDNTIDDPFASVHLGRCTVEIIKDFSSEKHTKSCMQFFEFQNFKSKYTPSTHTLSSIVPLLDITYSVEIIWSILFVKTVLGSLFGKCRTKNLANVDQTEAKTDKGSFSSLNIIFKLHLLRLHLVLPSRVELALELDSFVYLNMPDIRDKKLVSFNALRIYGQNPHIEGMWTLILILQNLILKINDNIRVDEVKFDVKCDAIRIEIPYEYVFYKTFDNLKALFKSNKVISHNFKDLMYLEENDERFSTSKLMPSIVENIIKLPKIRVRSNHFLYCNHDDPFEEELTSFFILGEVEQKIRMEKIRTFEKYETKMLKLLQNKYSSVLQFEDGKAIRPEGYADHMRRSDEEAKFMSRNNTCALSSNRVPVPVEKSRTDPIPPPTPVTVDKNIQDTFAAYTNYYREYREAIAVPKSRMYSNISKAWIIRVKSAKKGKPQSANDYFRNRSKNDPGVRKPFFKKFPIVSEGNSHPLFGFDVLNLDWYIDQPSFGVDNYQDFMHNIANGIPKSMKYGIFFPMNWKLGCSHMKIQIKDYPLPLIGLGSYKDKKNTVIFSGDFVVFEQEYSLDEIRYNYVPLVSQYDQESKDENLYSIHIPRTMTDVKFATDLSIDVKSKKTAVISWASALQPGIGYAMNSFDLLSKPPLDISPKIGFWDKFPLMLHGKAIFNLQNGLDLFIKSGKTPYDHTGRYSGFVFRWSDESKLKINSTGKSDDFLIVESNIFEIGIPSFDANYLMETVTFGTALASDYKIAKSVLKLTSKPIIWKLGLKFERNLSNQRNFEPGSVPRTSHFRPHYDIHLKNPITFASKDERVLWDSYEGWRSDYIYMAVSVYSRDQTGVEGFPCSGGNAYNALGLTPLTIFHFFTWWDSFKSSLGLPIKEGIMFQNKFITAVKSPKFGAHLYAISYSVDLSPLYLAHVYRHISGASAESKIAFTGLKCFVKSFVMDLHQTKKLITVFDTKTQKVRKEYHLKMQKGVVDFVEADLRILTAIFNQKYDMGQVSKTFAVPMGTSDSFQDTSSSNLSDYIMDKNWYEKNDFIELDTAPLPEEEPKWRLLLLASSPRFYYVREDPDSDIIYDYDEIERCTHCCQIGKRGVSSSAGELAQDRIKELEDVIDVHKMQIKDLESKPPSEFIRKMHTNLTIELRELHHRLHVLRCLKDKFSEGVFPEYDEFINDFELSEEEDSHKGNLKPNALSRISTTNSHATHISKIKSAISGIPVYSSNYRNRFIVYGINVKWTQHTKSGLLGYLSKVEDRRFLVFSLSQKAVNLAEEICKAHSSKNSSNDKNFFKDSSGEATYEFSNFEKNLNDLDLKLHDTSGLTNAKTEDSYLVKFFLPQISSSFNNKDCVLITSNKIVARNVTVQNYKTTEVMSDEIVLPIEDRTAVTVDDAFVYVLQREDLLNDVYKLFNARQLVWPPKLPLEMYYSPGSLDSSIVLQNLSAALYMVEPNDFHYAKDEYEENKKLKKTVKIIIPDVEIVTNSKQFGTLVELYKALSEKSHSQSERLKEVVDNYVKFLDVNDFTDVTKKLVETQREVRELTFCKRILSVLKEESGYSPEEMEQLNVKIEALNYNLNGIATFLRTLKAKRFNDSSELSKWSVLAPEINIRFINSEGHPMVDINAIDVLFESTTAPNGSTINNVYVYDLDMFDRNSKALYNTVLAKFSNTTEPFFTMSWNLDSPVGGISILHSQKAKFSPLQIAIDTRMTKELQKFLFPDSDMVNSNDFDTEYVDEFDLVTLDEDQASSELNRVNSQTSTTSSGSKDLGKHTLRKKLTRFLPHKQSKSANVNSSSSSGDQSSSSSMSLNMQLNHFGRNGSVKGSSFKNATLNIHDTDHVKKMKGRAKKFYALRKFDIEPMRLCITFKGQGKLRLVNMTDFIINIPRIELRDKLTSNEELFTIIRNKLVHVVLENGFSLIKSKLKSNKLPTMQRNYIQSNKSVRKTSAGISSHGHHHHSSSSSRHFQDVDLLEPAMRANVKQHAHASKPTLKELVSKQKVIEEEAVFAQVDDNEGYEDNADDNDETITEKTRESVKS